MLKKILIISCLIYIFSIQCKGQDTCLGLSNFQTDSVGNEKEKIKANLNFVITDDSIIIYSGKAQIYSFISFRILDKRCEWEKDFSEGKSSFKLLLKENGTEKYPILNLLYISKKNRFFELLYENSERRIFTIANSSD